MLDIGLSLGWAAGGPISDPGASTNATPVADSASAVALAGAFRDLVDAFAAGQPVPAIDPATDVAKPTVKAIPTSEVTVPASDDAVVAQPVAAPVESAPVVLTARSDAASRVLPGAASATLRHASISVDPLPQPASDEADIDEVDDADAVVVPVLTAVIDPPKALPIAALQIIPTASPAPAATTIADTATVDTASSRPAPVTQPAAVTQPAVLPQPVQRSDTLARDLPRATGGHKSAVNLPVAEDAALGPDVTDSAQRLPPARRPVALAAAPMAAIDAVAAVNLAGMSAPALTRILAAISETQSSADANAPAIKTAAALRIAADLQSIRDAAPVEPESQTNEFFGRDASQQPARTPTTPIAKFVIPGRATPGGVVPENPVRSSTSPVLPASTFSSSVFSSFSGAPMALTHLSPGGLQTLLASTSLTAVEAAEVGPRTADQIVQSIRLACSRDGGEAHIRLDPEQFGDLSVSVKVDGNGVVARLNADSPAVREWLQANHAALRDGLAGHDLRLDRLEVLGSDKSRESSERDGDKRRQQAYDQPQKRSKRSDTGQVFEIVA